MHDITAWLLAVPSGNSALPDAGAAAWAGVAAEVTPLQLPAALWPHQLGCVAAAADASGCAAEPPDNATTALLSCLQVAPVVQSVLSRLTSNS